MSSNREQFIADRAALLEKMTTVLKDDPRFVAAWLAGSFGRGEQRWISDLDIHVVVAEEFSESLCATPWMSGGRTTPERLTLFQQFGTPSIISEYHPNNTLGGTFTYVGYSDTGHNVDWMLIPQSKAHHESPSLILFEKVEIPGAPEEVLLTREQAAIKASDNIGGFWMIAAEAARDVADGDFINFHMLFDWLKSIIRGVKYALELRETPFKRNETEVYNTPAEQATALRQICDEMEALMPAVVELGGYVLPAGARVVVEKRLALVETEQISEKG